MCTTEFGEERGILMVRVELAIHCSGLRQNHGLIVELAINKLGVLENGLRPFPSTCIRTSGMVAATSDKMRAASAIQMCVGYAKDQHNLVAMTTIIWLDLVGSGLQFYRLCMDCSQGDRKPGETPTGGSGSWAAPPRVSTHNPWEEGR